MIRSIRPAWLAAALILALSLTACSAAGRSSSPPPSNPDSSTDYGHATDGPGGGFAARDPGGRRSTVDIRPRCRYRLVLVRQRPDRPAASCPGPRLVRPGGVHQRVRAAVPAADRQRVQRQRRRGPDAGVLRQPNESGEHAPAPDRSADPGRGRRPSGADAALTFVIDTSGSMSDAGKLDLVEVALHALVDQLRADRCGGHRGVQRPRRHRPADDLGLAPEADLNHAIDGLRKPTAVPIWRPVWSPGTTWPGKAFRGGATNRVVILSDGLANTGEHQLGPDPGRGPGAGRQADHPARGRRRQ